MIRRLLAILALLAPPTAAAADRPALEVIATDFQLAHAIIAQDIGWAWQVTTLKPAQSYVDAARDLIDGTVQAAILPADLMRTQRTDLDIRGRHMQDLRNISRVDRRRILVFTYGAVADLSALAKRTVAAACDGQASAIIAQGLSRSSRLDWTVADDCVPLNHDEIAKRLAPNSSVAAVVMTEPSSGAGWTELGKLSADLCPGSGKAGIFLLPITNDNLRPPAIVDEADLPALARCPIRTVAADFVLAIHEPRCPIRVSTPADGLAAAIFTTLNPREALPKDAGIWRHVAPCAKVSGWRYAPQTFTWFHQDIPDKSIDDQAACQGARDFACPPPQPRS